MINQQQQEEKRKKKKGVCVWIKPIYEPENRNKCEEGWVGRWRCASAQRGADQMPCSLLHPEMSWNTPSFTCLWANNSDFCWPCSLRVLWAFYSESEWDTDNVWSRSFFTIKLKELQQTIQKDLGKGLKAPVVLTLWAVPSACPG